MCERGWLVANERGGVSAGDNERKREREERERERGREGETVSEREGQATSKEE